MRILVVSQMWPGPTAPELGIFVAQVVNELERRGHEVARAVVDHRGGSRIKHLRLGVEAMTRALRWRPDVIYAHFLVPAGAFGALASVVARVPLVVTAHGQDVRNLGAIPGVRAATAIATRRAGSVIAVSDYLRRQLVSHVPAIADRIEIVDCGVDLDRFRPRDAARARQEVGWEGEGPFYLFVGTLDERKNVLGLRDAFSRLGGGSLAFVGDGPLRAALEGQRGVRLAGRQAPDAVAKWMAACDVLCLPSPVESFGQVLLEAMACERSVVATRVGGPAELVPAHAGVLVDPGSVDSIAEGMRAAAALPTPNCAAREVAAQHDLRLQAGRVERILGRAAGSPARRP